MVCWASSPSRLSSGRITCHHDNTELKEAFNFVERRKKKKISHLQFISSCRMGTSGLPTWLLILSTVCGFPLKTKVPYNPAVPLLGIYLKKTKTLIWKDKCTHMFMATLWTIAKPWKQPKCSSMGEWIKNIMEYYSAIKRIWSCHLQQHEWYYYAKWKKNRQIPPCLLCLDNSFKKKKKTPNSIVCMYCSFVCSFCMYALLLLLF